MTVQSSLPVQATVAALAAVGIAAVAITALRPQQQQICGSRTSPPRCPSYVPLLGNALRLGMNATEFVRSSHARYGDIFVTNVLGRDVIFVAGNLIQKAASASDRILDISKAYNIAFGSVLGEEVFGATTPSYARALTTARVDAMSVTLARIAAAAIEERFKSTSGQFSLADLTGEIVAIMSLSIICGFEYSLKHGAKFAKLLHTLESDFTAVGLLLPFETDTSRRRKQARIEMYALLEEYIRARIHELRDQPLRADDDYFTRIIHTVYYGRSDTEEHENTAAVKASMAAATAAGFDDVSETHDLGVDGKDHEKTIVDQQDLESTQDDMNEKHIHNIVAYALTLVFAAHTNTAVSAAYVLQQLLKHPNFIQSILVEANEHLGADIAETASSYLARIHAAPKSQPKETSPFLRMVHTNRIITETARVFGTGSLIRYSAQDFPISDQYFIPKGTLVAISSRLCSIDANIYGDDASKWNPRRYDTVYETSYVDASGKSVRVPLKTWNESHDDAKPDAQSVDHAKSDRDSVVFVGKLDDLQSPSTSIKNLQMASFGCGRHLCPGRTLAYRVVSILTVTMLRRFDMELVRGFKSMAELPFAGMSRPIGDATVKWTVKP